MSSKATLNDFIKNNNFKENASFVFSLEPYLETVATRLIEFATPNFVVNGKPVYEILLTRALSNIQQDDPHHKTIKNFLTNIVHDADLFITNRITVETKLGMKAWVPMEETVAQFLSKYEEETPVMTGSDPFMADSINKKDASVMLSVHIMPSYAFKMVHELIEEATVE